MANLAAIRAAAAEVDVILNDKQFVRDLTNVERRIRTMNSRIRFIGRFQGFGPSLSSMLKGLTKIGSALKTMGDRIKAVGTSFKEAGGQLLSTGFLSLIGLAVPIDKWVKFSDAIQELKTKTGASVKEMEQLSRAARDVGLARGLDPTEIARGFVSLGKAGQTTNDILSVGPNLAAFARATSTDMERAGDIIVNTANQFDISMRDNERIMDVLTATVDGSTLSMEDYAEASKQVGRIARQAGDSFESTSASIAMLADASLKGTEAGNGLKRAYLNIVSAAPVKKFNDLSDAMGIARVSFKDASGNIRPMVDIMTDLGQVTKSLGTGDRLQLLNTLFGGRGVVTSSTFAENVDKMRDFRDKLKDVGGITKRTADVMDSGIGGALRKAKASAVNFAIEFGKTFDAEITGAASSLKDFLNGSIGVIQSNKKLVSGFAIAAAAATIAGASFIVLGVGIQLVGRALTAFGSATLVISRILSFALLSPIGIVVTALALAGASFIKFSDIGRDAFNRLISFFSGFAQRVGGFVTDIGNAIAGGDLGAAVAVLRAGAAQELALLRLEFSEITTEVVAGVQMFATDAASAFSSGWASVADTMRAVFGDSLNFLSDAFSTFATNAGNSITSVEQGLSGVLQKMAQFDSSSWGRFFKDSVAQIKHDSQHVALEMARVWATLDSANTITDANFTPMDRLNEMVERNKAIDDMQLENDKALEAGAVKNGESAIKRRKQVAAEKIQNRKIDQGNADQAKAAVEAARKRALDAVNAAKSARAKIESKVEKPTQISAQQKKVEDEWRKWLKDRKAGVKPLGKAGGAFGDFVPGKSKAIGTFSAWAAQRLGGTASRFSSAEKRMIGILRSIDKNMGVAADALDDLEAA